MEARHELGALVVISLTLLAVPGVAADDGWRLGLSVDMGVGGRWDMGRIQQEMDRVADAQGMDRVVFGDQPMAVPSTGGEIAVTRRIGAHLALGVSAAVYLWKPDQAWRQTALTWNCFDGQCQLPEPTILDLRLGPELIGYLPIGAGFLGHARLNGGATYVNEGSGSGEPGWGWWARPSLGVSWMTAGTSELFLDAGFALSGTAGEFWLRHYGPELAFGMRLVL